MKLQDYIQYYLHCDFYLVMRQRKTRITNYWPMQDKEHCVGYGLDGDNGVEDIKHIKPILRAIEFINDDEALELAKLQHDSKRHKEIDILYVKKDHLHYIDGTRYSGDGWSEYNEFFVYFNQLNPQQTHYLIRHNIDVFGLIEKELAIDSKTLK